METTQLCCHCPSISLFDILSIVLTALGLIISIFFVIRPRLQYCAYKRTNGGNANTSMTNQISQQSTNNEQSVKNSSVNKHIDIDPYGEEIWEDEDQCPDVLDYSSNALTKSTAKQGNNSVWVVKVENKNWFCVIIREIQCEIALSSTSDFKMARTLKLRKPSTLFLKSVGVDKNNNYLFTPLRNVSFYSNSRYKYLRVRLLASNFLGVKKHYERIYSLDSGLNDDKTYCQCHHTKKNRTLQTIVA